MSTYLWNNFWSKISTWEYWPAWFFNIPVLFMWLIQAIRNRNLFFFSRVNPDIETGGFFSEKKWPIYAMFPPVYIPLGILIECSTNSTTLKNKLNNSNLSLPLLAKPNIGERGMGILKINSIAELISYNTAVSFDYILQEFIDYPLEMSVLAYRKLDSDKPTVTSVCLKEKLTILGDGHSTLTQLVNKDFRSRKQWPRLSSQFDEDLVLEKGKRLILDPIGNHSRGTTFLDGNYLINDSFSAAIGQLFNSIKGEVYYGRFDIIYKSMLDFVELKNFKVIEFNGVGSEPAHIYQPGFSLFNAYQSLWQHAKILGNISLQQKKRGVQSMSWKEFKLALKVYRKNMKVVQGAQINNKSLK